MSDGIWPSTSQSRMSPSKRVGAKKPVAFGSLEKSAGMSDPGNRPSNRNAGYGRSADRRSEQDEESHCTARIHRPGAHVRTGDRTQAPDAKYCADASGAQLRGVEVGTQC